jgi:hypothetical protein
MSQIKSIETELKRFKDRLDQIKVELTVVGEGYGIAGTHSMGALKRSALDLRRELLVISHLGWD